MGKSPPLGSGSDRYRVADLTIDAGKRSVSRGAQAIPVPGLSFDLLLVLIHAAPNLVSYDELMRSVWPGLVVNPETVSQRIKLLRKALGDDAREPRYIVGVRGHGSRLAVMPEPLAANAPAGFGPGALSASTTAAARARPGGRRRTSVSVIVALVVAVISVGGYNFVDYGSQKVAREKAAAWRPAHARSIVVLPFVAMSRGEDDDYFADGLTEEILNSLSQLSELRVTARSSAFSLKRQELTAQEIASRLGVRHVVEGSVRRAGNRLRVTAQLVRADDGVHLWSENYDSTSQNVIQVQEDIAVKIAVALDVVLDDARRDNMRRAGLRDVDAFIALQKGNERFDAAHGEDDQVSGLLEANRYFDQVLERVPGYPPALIAHADAYAHRLSQSAWKELTPDAQLLMEEAQAHAISDLSVAASHARSFEERAAIEFDLTVVTGDMADLKRRLLALLAGSDCQNPGWVGPFATVFGYAHQLDQRLEPVLACDPLTATNSSAQSRAALWSGDPGRSLDLAVQARELTPHPWLDLVVFQSMLALGRIEAAADEIALRTASGPGTALHRVVAAAAAGDRNGGDRALARLREEADGNDFFLLQALAVLGYRAEANQAAGRVDQRALGPLPLVLVTLFCGCGAPFDLTATPNFAALLAEGELPWPPRSPIDFPFKDW